MPFCDQPVNNGQYAAFIYYNSNLSLETQSALLGVSCIDFVDRNYSIVYTPLEDALPLSIKRQGYTAIPKLYSLLDTSSMEASGILPANTHPTLGLGGAGTLIGFIDTGIDYTNPLFRNPDGTTRIKGIWDQTVTDPPYGFQAPSRRYPILYGREYLEPEINAALASDNPYSLIPPMDTDGHGTFMAGIAAGNNLPEQNFTGAAPDCSICAVRLRPASQYLRDFFLIREDATAYQENDIMMGVQYLLHLSALYQMPVTIFIGLGTNQGSHNGSSPLSQTLQQLNATLGVMAVAAAGNETGRQHHYQGQLAESQEYEDVEINVGPGERGFCLELWAREPEIYTVGFISPTGQQIPRLSFTGDSEVNIPFLLEGSQITVNFRLTEAGSGSQLIFMRFQNPTPGIWKIRVFNALYISGQYHMWLPIHGFISEQTVFLKPNPDTIVTDPGNADFPLTMGAYNHINGSIYLHSSRGFTRYGRVKPDLVAPGVAISGPALPPQAALRALPGETVPPPGSTVTFTQRTGTSVAAAHAAGAVASLLSWGLVQNNEPAINETTIKATLIRGASRNPAYSYPSKEWGYGMLNLYQSFERMRE